MDIIKTVTDWPVIVQGALGSALFWAILELGQRIVRRSAERLTKDNATANWFALAAFEAPPNVAVKARFICMYGAVHYLLKALIVVVLSWVISPLFNIFSSFGYLIAVYFLFRALSHVPHAKSFGPVSERNKKFKDSVSAILIKEQAKNADIPKDAATKI